MIEQSPFAYERQPEEGIQRKLAFDLIGNVILFSLMNMSMLFISDRTGHLKHRMLQRPGLPHL
uniref:Uncharacterized protein n=1 Tax=Anguilla anguilla TaxID=7936 RepID=A0A0E9P9R2_ANGAN